MPPRAINALFLAILLGTLAIFGTGTHFLHAYQLRRHSRAYLQQADYEEAEGKPEQAILSLRNYLQYEPEDTDALARWGLLLDKQAKRPQQRSQAVSVLQQVLNRDATRGDVRLRVAQILVEQDRFADAAAHLEILTKETPNNAELELQLGRCRAGVGNAEAADVLYASALRHDPSLVEAAVRRVALLRGPLNQPKRADEVMDELVKANPKLAQAYLTRADYRRLHGTAEGAREDIAKARELAPDDANVLVLSAGLAAEKGQNDEARAYLKRGQEKYPKDSRFYNMLARLSLSAGKPDQAIAALNQGLEQLPDDAEMLMNQAELLVASGKRTEALALLAKMRKLKARPELIDFYDAQLFLAEGKQREGRQVLERVRPLLAANFPVQSRKADLLLGKCYESTGDWEQAVALYRQRVLADRLWPTARYQLAAALLATGKYDEAVQTCSQLVGMKDAPPVARVLHARAAVLRALSQPPAQRAWPEVEQLLDAAAKAVPDADELLLYRADALAAQGKVPQALALATQYRDKHADQLPAWNVLLRMTERHASADKALAVLDQVQAKFGDTPDVRLMRALYWSKRRGPEAKKALDELAKLPEKFTPAERTRLQEGLGDAFFRIGEVAEAEKLWNDVAAREPTNLSVRLRLFDTAARGDKDEVAPQLAVEIRRAEGEDGVFWRYAEASLALRQVRRGQKDALARARTLASEIASRQTSWSRVPLLQAEIQELDGNHAQALDYYLRALDLGEEQPRVVSRAVQLLTEQRRLTEADKLVRKYQERNPLSAELGHLAAETALRLQDKDRALELARQVVAPNSKDYREALWISRFLLAADRKDEAEAALRKAAELGGHEPATWISLLSFLSRYGQKEQADAVLAEAAKKLPTAKVPLTLAQGYELLGRSAEAEKQYRAALAAQPDDTDVIRQVVSMHMRRGQLAEAEPLLRKLLPPQRATRDETTTWARRSLAAVLAARGYPGQLEALALVEENLKTNGGTVEDQRAKADILARLPGRQQEAILLLESSRAKAPLAPDEQLFLARLYAVRNWPKARELMQGLLATHGDNPVYLASYITSLLGRREKDEAAIWMERLEKLDADNLNTVALKARLSHLQGNSTEAGTLLKQFAQKHGTESFAQVALVLEQVGQPSAAEELLQKLAADASKPEAGVLLVGFLARQGRVPEALDRLEKAWPLNRPEVAAATALNVLGQVRLTDDQARRVQQPITAALEKQPTNTVLLNALAILNDLHLGRTSEAIVLYRRTLAAAPNDATALNNLAILLALHENNIAEAMPLIERALQQTGPQAAVLDSRALIYLKTGQTDLALKDLTEAVATAGSGPRYFHLAQAQLAAGNRRSAREAMDKARELGLKPENLHPLERGPYEKLIAELATK